MIEKLSNTNDLLQMMFDGGRVRVELNGLRAFGPSLLNRDENGDAKKVNVGCIPRTAISSQCRKSAIRNECIEVQSALSRRAPEIITAYICDHYGVDRKNEELVKFYLTLCYSLLTEKDKELAQGKLSIPSEDSNPNWLIDTPVRICAADVKRIADSIMKYFSTDADFGKIEEKKSDDGKKKSYEFTKEESKDSFVKLYKELKAAIASYAVEYDVCLFGRMATSTIVKSYDSAANFNEAYSTTPCCFDSDFFTTRDTLYDSASVLFSELDTATGSGHMNSRDITADTFYWYSNYNLNAYIENIMIGFDYSDKSKENEEVLKMRIREAFDYLIEVTEKTITTVPATMQHQMASSPDPAIVHVAVKKNSQPKTMDFAFAEPVYANDGVSVLDESVNRFVEEACDNTFETGEFMMECWLSKAKYANEIKNVAGAERTNLHELISELKRVLYETIDC